MLPHLVGSLSTRGIPERHPSSGRAKGELATRKILRCVAGGGRVPSGLLKKASEESNAPTATQGRPEKSHPDRNFNTRLWAPEANELTQHLNAARAILKTAMLRGAPPDIDVSMAGF